MTNGNISNNTSRNTSSQGRFSESRVIPMNDPIPEGSPESVLSSILEPLSDTLTGSFPDPLSESYQEYASASNRIISEIESLIPRGNVSSVEIPGQNNPEQVEGPSITIGRFCPLCNHIFSRKGELNNHIQIVHEGRSDVRCPHCSKIFGTNDEFIQHMSSEHENKTLHQCVLCSSYYTKYIYLKSHIELKHRANFSPMLVKSFGKNERRDRETSKEGGENGPPPEIIEIDIENNE